MRYKFHMNESAFKLSSWLKDKKVSQAKFAKMLDVSRATMSRILNGKQMPNIELATKIEVLTGVRVAGWLAKVKITMQAAE